MSVKLVENLPGALEIWQAMYAGNGIRAVAATVPERPLQEGESLRQFLVLDEYEVPFGLLSEIDLGEGIAEVGVRFWERNPRIALILADWLGELLRTYSVLVVRCFSNNHPVKKLLQRGGFRLFRIEGRIEFYVVNRDTFMGREKEAGLHG